MLKLASFAALGLALLLCGAEAQDRIGSSYPPSGGAFAGAQVGGHIGAAIGGTGDVSPTGVTAGGYAGYSLQNGPIVGGVEVDTQVGSVSGGGRGGTLNQNWLTSLRARGGYAFGDVLAYGTVGPAWATSNFSRNGFSADKPLHGYTFGVGAELAVTRTISARAELRHYEFDGATYYMPGGAQKLSTGNNELLVGAGVHF
jgi:outer membrane immunogenic protein